MNIFTIINSFKKRKGDIERKGRKKKIDPGNTFNSLYASNRSNELLFSLIHFPIKTIGKPIKLFDGFEAI